MGSKEYKWTSKQLRKRFLDFFEKKDHLIVPSASVVPLNDPTLLFVNSGMVQFKKYFLNSEEVPPCDKITDVQHCIRAGGKHNDLEDVGKDNYHHTFFEMMGSWSFGDYFKEKAIEYAFMFLTEDLKIDPERLYVSVYEDMDLESKKIWLNYIPEERIVKGDKKDNFWEMGEFGPCGPCTEIHYDRIGGRNAAHLVNMDDPNVLEIWNIVFMEFEKRKIEVKESGENFELVPLKRKCIDTGIGLERLLSILNGFLSNYLIDSFSYIIEFLEKNCDFTYTDNDNVKEDVAFRVVADHARTIAVCLSYGVTFSNTGVGYVLRRILRRAKRYIGEVLKIKEGVLRKAVEIAADKSLDLSNFEKIDFVTVDSEEELFSKTLSKGILKFKNMIANSKLGIITSREVFTLYDTYGFPFDLTKLMAEESNIKIDLSEIDDIIAESKRLSRAKSGFTEICAQFDFPPTDDHFKYETNNITATLKAIVLDNINVSKIPFNKEFVMIFDETCFYGECGGQTGDEGSIKILKTKFGDIEIKVLDTKILRGYVIHYCILENSKIDENALIINYLEEEVKCILSYDVDFRRKCMRNHSSVHIFGYVLDKYFPTTIGTSTYLDEKKGHVDYSNKGTRLVDIDIQRLEDKMNDIIQLKIPRELSFYETNEALRNDPDCGFFEDLEYPCPVRCIEFNAGVGWKIKDACGGTHVENTGDIKKFIIVSETCVKTGIRRFIFVSGDRAEELEKETSKLLESLKNGKTILIPEQLPYLKRKEIERLNVSLRRELTKKVNSQIKACIKDIIQNISSLTLKSDKFSILKIDGMDCGNTKQVSKGLKLITSQMEKDKISGVVYSKMSDCDDTYISSYSCHDELEARVKVELDKKFPNLRITGGLINNDGRFINGIVEETELDEFLQLFK